MFLNVTFAAVVGSGIWIWSSSAFTFALGVGSGFHGIALLASISASSGRYIAS